ATAPHLFESIAANLALTGLAGANTRIVIEKPIGHSLPSALNINAAIGAAFSEEQVFRIDHYLGKETVQNLMALRFANALFEPVWRAAHIDRSEERRVGKECGSREALRDCKKNLRQERELK